MINHLKKNFNIVSVFFLGFSSGLPFYLLVSTLIAWLIQSGISKTNIGLFFWVTITYSLKFLWSPIIENVKIPFLSKCFGRRRSWLLLSQATIIIFLLLLSKCDPSENFFLVLIISFFIGFFSSTQDIVIEAYRIEILPHNKIGIGSSLSVLGYRFGMMCSGAGSLYVAEFFGWNIAIKFIAFSLFLGVITTLFSKEPSIKFIKGKNTFKRLVIEPFHYFIKKNNWLIIIPFILFFKCGDSILNAMSIPFLLEIGFSKLEIASVAKTFGISAMILGTIISGVLQTKRSLRTCLIISVLLQILSCVFFVIQANVGNWTLLLFFTIGIENIASGISQVSLITYLSKLCKIPYAGSQYALISSYASFSRVVLSFCGGCIADLVNWSTFYILISIFCFPALFILFFAKKHFFMISNGT